MIAAAHHDLAPAPTPGATIRSIASRIAADASLRHRVVAWAVELAATSVAAMRGAHQARAVALLAAAREWLGDGSTAAMTAASASLELGRGAWVRSICHLATSTDDTALYAALYELAVTHQPVTRRAAALSGLVAASVPPPVEPDLAAPPAAPTADTVQPRHCEDVERFLRRAQEASALTPLEETLLAAAIVGGRNIDAVSTFERLYLAQVWNALREVRS